MRRLFPFYLLMVVSFVWITSCHEEVIPQFPIVELGEVHVAETGVIVHGSIRNIQKSEVVAFGFIWSEEIASNRGVPAPSFRKELKIDDFNGYQRTELHTLKKGVTYHISVFCQTSDNTFYSQAQKVVSLGSKRPMIDDVEPTLFGFGDTITIRGKYFGLAAAAGRVWFNEDSIKTLNASDSSIQVIVPFLKKRNSYFSSDHLEIRVQRDTQKSDPHQVDILPPDIDKLNPEDSVQSGYSFEIEGSGFHPDVVKVSLGSNPLRVISCTRSKIVVKAPLIYGKSSGPITVGIGQKQVESDGVIVVNGPEFNEDLSGLKVYPNQNVILTGRNLNNEHLTFKFDHQRVQSIEKLPHQVSFQVNEDICSTSTDFSVLVDTAEVLNVTLDTRAPVVKRVTASGDFKASFQVDITNSGFNYPDIFINEQRAAEIRGSKVNENTHRFTFGMPRQVLVPDGFCDLRVNICGTTIMIDSVHFIPKPTFNLPSKLASYQKYSLSGNALDGELIEVLVDGTQIEAGSTYRSDDIWVELPNLSDGVHQMIVKINGRVSDPVSFRVENVWRKIADFGDKVAGRSWNEDRPIAFIADGVIYLGAGHFNSSSFYAYDINMDTWNSLASLPIRKGSTSNDESNGYLFDTGKFYRYSLREDKWKSLPGTEGFEDLPSHYHTSFITNNKFFHFWFGNSGFQYFDIPENSWVKVDAGVQNWRTTSLVHSMSYGTEVYLYHYDSFYGFDPSNQTVTSVKFYSYDNFYAEGSHQGAIYDGELFIFNQGYWEIVNKSDFSFSKRFYSPFYGRNTKVLQKEHLVYMIHESEIWEFDLSKL